MDKNSTARIQSAGAKNTSSDTHQSGFDRRAQSTADKGTAAAATTALKGSASDGNGAQSGAQQEIGGKKKG